MKFMNMNINTNHKALPVIALVAVALISGAIGGVSMYNIKQEPATPREVIVYDCSGVTGERFAEMTRRFDTCVEKTTMWQTCSKTAERFYCKPVKKSNM